MKPTKCKVRLTPRAARALVVKRGQGVTLTLRRYLKLRERHAPNLATARGLV